MNESITHLNPTAETLVYLKPMEWPNSYYDDDNNSINNKKQYRKNQLIQKIPDKILIRLKGLSLVVQSHKAIHQFFLHSFRSMFNFLELKS